MTRFHPDRVVRHASRDRVIPANEPVRQLEPGIHRHRLLKLPHVRASRLFLKRERLRRHPTIRTTTTHGTDRTSED